MGDNKRTCGHIYFKEGAGSALIKCPDCELELREQIAREILAEGPWCDNPHHREEGRKSANDCPCYIFAVAIARGEHDSQ